MQKFDVYSALLAETDNKLKENLFWGDVEVLSGCLGQNFDQNT